MKADVDFLVQGSNVEFRPDIGIRRLILVGDEEEKPTESDAIKAIVNLLLSQQLSKKNQLDLPSIFAEYLPCAGLKNVETTYEQDKVMKVTFEKAEWKDCEISSAFI